MKEPFRAAELVASWLILALALPSSVFALRSAGLEESHPDVKASLVKQLTTAPPTAPTAADVEASWMSDLRRHVAQAEKALRGPSRWLYQFSRRDATRADLIRDRFAKIEKMLAGDKPPFLWDIQRYLHDVREALLESGKRDPTVRTVDEHLQRARSAVLTGLNIRLGESFKLKEEGEYLVAGPSIDVDPTRPSQAILQWDRNHPFLLVSTEPKVGARHYVGRILEDGRVIIIGPWDFAIDDVYPEPKMTKLQVTSWKWPLLVASADDLYPPSAEIPGLRVTVTWQEPHLSFQPTSGSSGARTLAVYPLALLERYRLTQTHRPIQLVDAKTNVQASLDKRFLLAIPDQEGEYRQFYLIWLGFGFTTVRVLEEGQTAQGTDFRRFRVWWEGSRPNAPERFHAEVMADAWNGVNSQREFVSSAKDVTITCSQPGRFKISLQAPPGNHPPILYPLVSAGGLEEWDRQIAVLKDNVESWPARRDAIRNLERNYAREFSSHQNATIDALVWAIHHATTAYVRQEAADVLGRIGSWGVVRELQGTLKGEPELTTRAAMVEAIANIQRRYGPEGGLEEVTVKEYRMADIVTRPELVELTDWSETLGAANGVLVISGLGRLVIEQRALEVYKTLRAAGDRTLDLQSQISGRMRMILNVRPFDPEHMPAPRAIVFGYDEPAPEGLPHGVAFVDAATSATIDEILGAIVSAWTGQRIERVYRAVWFKNGDLALFV